MFTWICPTCGKEIQPHENECPYCREAAKAPSDSSSEAPQQVRAAAQTTRAPQGQRPPAPQAKGRRQMPGWLVALLVAAALICVAVLVYTYAIDGQREQTTAVGESPFEEVPEAGSAVASEDNRLNRFIEATGFRVTEDPNRRLQVRFLIVNHSAADFGDVAGTVHLGSTESDTTYASVDFRTTGLGPYESIEFNAILSTSIRAYEVPDWQFLRGDLEITYPSGMR